MANNIWIKRAAKARGVDEETYLKSRMGGNNGQGNEPARSPENIWVKRAAASAGMDTASYLASRALRSGTRSEQSDGAASWLESRAQKWAQDNGFRGSLGADMLKGGRSGGDVRPSSSIGARNPAGNIDAVAMAEAPGGIKAREEKTVPNEYESVLAELEPAKSELDAATQALDKYYAESNDRESAAYYALVQEHGRALKWYNDLQTAKEKEEFYREAKEQAGDLSPYVTMTDEELNARIEELERTMDETGFVRGSGATSTGGGRNKSDGGGRTTGGGRNRTGTGYYRDSEAYRAALAEYTEIQKEVERRQELQKYASETNGGGFLGQVESSFDVGELTNRVNEAYSNYLWNPTADNKAYADQLAATLKQYQENNAAALSDGGVVNTVSGYLPEFGHQLEAGTGGAIALAVPTFGVTSLFPGVRTAATTWAARAGWVGGVGVYSFNQMRGAAYRRFIEMGVDEQTARAAATDEAVINALIEMADAGLDIATLGTSNIANPSVKKVAKFLLNYGINIGGEALEEGAQELTSITNDERVANHRYDPNSSLWTRWTDLSLSNIGTVYDIATGENPEAAKQVWESMKGGATIAAIFGGGTKAAGATYNTITANNTGKLLQGSGGDTVQTLIDLGRNADPKTDSYKTATYLLKKQNTGRQISNTEVGWLYRALQEDKVFDQQPTTNRAQTENEVSREAVTERENGTQSASETLMEPATETVAERNASQQTQAGAATAGKSRSATDYTAAVKKWTGYGDNGVKTFVTAVEQSGADPGQVRARFQSAYEVGRLGTPRESVELNGDLQQQAYIAGHLDYLADQAKDKANTFKVSNEAGFDRTGAPADVTDTQAEILDMLAKNLGSKSYFDGDQDFNAEIRGDGTVRYSTSFQREIRDENGNVVKTLTVVNHALHELGAHRAMQIAPEATRSFVNKFYGYLMENSPATAATLAERKQQFYGSRGKSLTTDKAFEEVIANEIFPVLYGSNEQQLRESLSRIFNGTDEQVRQIKKGARTFKDVLHDMWQKIKDFAAKLRRKGDIAAAREAEQVAADIKELRDMFENVLKIAAEQVKAKQENSIENRAEQEYNGNNESQLSAKYWKPQLTKKEWNLLNTRMEREIGSSRRVIDDATKWLYANENGTTVFAIYGIGDGTVPTPLYASGSKRANQDYQLFIAAGKEFDNVDRSRESLDRWFKNRRRKQRKSNGDLAAAQNRRSADGHAGVHSGERDSDGSGNRAAGKENHSSVITDEDTQYSLVTDEETLDFLNGQKLVKVYRAMQEIDGKLYPPMAAITKGADGKNQLAPSTKKGAWYQSDERPDLIKNDKKTGKPYFELKKGNGKTVPAAYNPYFHTSVTPLNDQFSSAYDRPNLVVVEGYIPESELTSGYKAQYAKDSVGETTWHAGPVASKLKGDKARRVFLSRWFKAERVVPVEEVARTVAKTLYGEGVSVPWNVVTPSLREALEKQGVEIDYKDIKMGSKVVSFESTQYSLKNNNIRHKENNDFNILDVTIDDILKWSDDDFDRAYKELGLDRWVETDEILLDDDFDVEDISDEVDVEPEVIEILYRRRGLGDSHISEDKMAVMTVKRIDERIADSGATRADYARRYITRISPKDFIDMTVYERNMDRASFDANVRGDSDSRMGDWDYAKQIHESKEPPVLDINTATGQIIGHNGRHRMRALEMAGIESVEIEVALYDGDGYLIKYDAETIPDMAISSQFDTKIETHISNIIPLNKAHRAEIMESYGETAHENAGVMFSLKTPVEQTRNLIALHNLTEDKLLKSISLGGFPMPSIAVTATDIPHTNFGDITLVMSKTTIDPKFSRKNTVYSADAWTPTFPQIEYEADPAAEKKISSMYYDLAKTHGYDFVKPLYGYAQYLSDELNRQGGVDGIIERRLDDTSMMQVYLAASGKEPVADIKRDVVTRLDQHAVERYDYLIDKLGEDVVNDLIAQGNEHPMEAKKRWVSEHGEELTAAYRGYLSDSGLDADVVENVMEHIKIGEMLREVVGARNYLATGAETVRTETDTAATNEAIRKAAGDGYEAWLRDLFSGAVKDTGIYNNKELYTPSGNRRSFKQTHYPVTLENIAKAMAEQNDGNTKNVSGFYGIKSLRAGTAKRFSSIKEMHEYEGRLKHLTQEEADAITDALSKRMNDLIERIYDTRDHGKYSNSFLEMDAIGNMLMEMAELETKTIDSLSKKSKERHYQLNNGILAEIRDLLFDVAQMPVNIFEAKPERVVRFDEVLAAVLPDDASQELRDALEAQGVSVLTYEKGNDAARLETINGVDGAQFSLKEHNDLLKENAKLKEVNEALREQFKRTEFAQVDKKSLDKFTKQLLKDYQSGADINEIRDALSDVYTYMANGEDGQSAAWNDLQERAYNVAVSILQEASTVNDDMYQAYKGLRGRLRNYPISIDKRYDHDIQGYESINDFRKANFGKIKITNDGTPVDIVYSDLANTYPEFFDESKYTTQADQLSRIAEVLDSLQPYEVNPYSANMRQAATWLASDIIERFYDLPQAKPTFADKQAAKLTKQVIKDAKKLENLREKKNERIKELIRNNREKVKATTQKEREKRVAAVKEVKEHYKAKEKKASESRKARTLRAKIMRHAQEMSKKLLRPTDKQHIPQNLQGAVAKLLESINLESKYETAYGTDGMYHRVEPGTVLGAEATARTKAFAELRKLYAEMANELVIDPDLLGEDGLLSDVAALADKRIADMTSEELETVYQTLRAIEATVSSANKAFAESRWASIEEAAESIREENKNKRQITEYRGLRGFGQKLTGLDMMTPEAYFHYLGESGDAIFRMMRNAQDKHIALMKSVEDFTHKELENVPVKKWENEIHTVKLGGEDVQLTTAQIMELYVLTKRKQAQEHIFKGGILPESIETKGSKKITRAEPVRGIDIGEVSKAVSLLTEEQKKVSEKLQQYASTELSRWGNEAAMQVYNYEKFNEEIYWPIRSNRQEISSTVEKDTQVTSVAGRGFSKNTKPNANTSVKIGSIFDTFANHSSEMATYAAWLAPAEDINRIRNYTFLNENGGRDGTVKGIIERIHGSRGTQYLQKLLSDIANGVGAGRGNETRMDKIVGNYKASAIGANLRVIIQQPTALLRALDMIDAKYIASVKNPMSGWKKAKQYAPIAQWKDWGYFDINTGRQMKDVLFDTDSAMEKAKQVTMAGAGLADSISWGTLWNAVENEVAATRKELKPNTEEFYKAVAARFTEIVDHTQVVDGILQRSQIMRSADGLTKMATSFMGEPTKQYNMVMTALYDFRHTEGKERTIARKRFGRTMTALVISGVVNAMAQSIIDAVRDDDEEKEYWEKWLTAFFGLKGDEETIGEKAKAIIFGSNLANIFNPAGYIPYAKDVVSLLAGYDVSRMDMESIEKTISSWNNLWKAINGEGGYTIQGAAINFIGEAARLFGVPVANIKREIVSFTTMTAQETDSFMMQYYIEKFFTNVNNSSGGSMNILYNAYKEDKDEFEALYARMLKDDLLKTEDKTTAEVIAGKLQSKLVKDLYELYKTDPKAYEEMYDDLVERDFLKTGVKSSDPEKDTFVSTEEHIASAMESLMKKDQGVDKVGDLESRYFGPDQQREYDQKMREIQSNSVWRSATEEQREKVEDNLRGIVLGSDSKMLETIEEGTPYGLDDTEYLLYKLALETVDQPNENGKLGTYTNEEKARAFASLNLGDGEMAFLWGTDQALEAYAYGIDMEKYITFKAAIGNIVADKDRRGNTISGSRRKKIIAYLRSLGVSQKEYWYLLGTEFDLKDDPNYRRYFGR